MDARRALPFLLLVICAISAASIIRNGRGGLNNIRRIRRINLSEYLVPPPPPKFHPLNRIARLVTPQPIEAPGYFAQLMNWLNPFGSSSKTLPLSPPPLPHIETSHLSSSSKFISPAPAEIYGSPSPVTYDKPPSPVSSLNNYPGYPSLNKAKNCNSCNKVPWMPIQHDGFSHSEDASFVSSPPSLLPQLSSSLNGEYLPPRNREIPYDAHHAASQEIRAPDFSFAPPLLAGEQDGSFINPLPNPHLYPGAMPPLFKAEDFKYSVQAIPESNSKQNLDASLLPPLPSSPLSVFGDAASTESGSFSNTAEFSFNSGASIYPDLLNSDREIIHQELEYINPDTSNHKATTNREFEHFNAQNYGTHNDLSSSGTHDHSDLISEKQKFENIVTQSSLDSINYQTFDYSGVSIDQNLPSSYGISGLDRIPDNVEHQYNDLSSSANVVEDSRTPLYVTAESSSKIKDSIHFEKSLLLDFTHKGESQTDLSSIPPTSNVFTDSTNTKIVGTILTLDEEISGTRNNTTTESYYSSDHFKTINFSTSLEDSKINNSVIPDSNKNLYEHKAFQEQNVSYIPPSDQVGYLWSNILSTTSRNTESRELWNTLNSELNSHDDVAEETQNFTVKLEDANKTSIKQQDAKRNKQVQLIIPYTSQYTPLSFHLSHERNHEALHFASESNHDKYFSEESKNIKVTSLPNSSYIWSTTSALLKDITRKPVDIKVNNSIDVHKLQKNIDNWTIQEYSKGTTASTVSPSSVNPYLFPSKQIPDKYLTTTEPVNHAVGSYDDNVKTFTLAGFSFNDLDYKGSASNHVEGQRVQVTENSKSIASSTDASTTSTKNDITWQNFSVDISSVNKERVYVVTPQSITTPKLGSVEKKKEKTIEEADKNLKVLKTDMKKIKKKSNTFESIEKAYQVLPQAVNNLAVASTGPESVSLWGIMEHEEFASLDENEHENENSESLEIPVLYAGHSKVSRAKR